jgi:hypothetical protein
LKSVDLPTFGRPTMPHLKPMEAVIRVGEVPALMRGLRAKGKGAGKSSRLVGHDDQRTPTALISRKVEL